MADRRRAPKGKKINPTIFIFCEGETEVAYVNLMKSLYRLPSIQIHARIKGNNITEEYIDKYKKDKPTHEKDITCLFYDLDVPQMLERLSSIENSILLVSNPVLELWFLLHYKNQKAQTNSRYCCNELKKRNNGYKKGLIDNNLRKKLIEKQKEAARRAKALSYLENPSTTVYKLPEMLSEIKKEN